MAAVCVKLSSGKGNMKNQDLATNSAISSVAIHDLLSIVCQSTSDETRRDFFNCARRHGLVDVVDTNGDYKVNGITYKIIS